MTYDELKKILDSRDLTAMDFCKLSNVSPQAISNAKRRGGHFSGATMEKIRVVLDEWNTNEKIYSSVSGSENYYINDEAKKIAQMMFDNENYKVLFDAVKNVKPEDIDKVAQMIKLMVGE